MRKLALTAICILLIFCPVAFYSTQAQTTSPAASVRNITVESITAEKVTLLHQTIPIDATHFVYTFAMWKVNQWADRAYFVAETSTGQVVAKWSVGFSVTGGLQGVYMDWTSDILQVQTYSVDFPYKTQVATDAVDGTQQYRYYRIHFYFAANLIKGETVTVTGDYMKDPQTGITQTPQLTSTSNKDSFIVSAATVSSTGSKTELKILSVPNQQGGNYGFTTINTPTPTPTPQPNYNPWALLKQWFSFLFRFHHR